MASSDNRKFYTMQEYFERAFVKFSCNEILKEIKEYDSTIEIVGYVDEIEGVIIVGPELKKVFKFFLNNGQGNRIQVKVWQNEIERVIPIIKLNHVLHLDGVASRPINAAFNKGSVPCELLIQSNTELNSYRSVNNQTDANDETEVKLITFPDVCNTTRKFKIQGFIKTMFIKEIDFNSKNFLYIIGSITNGVYKLEVRIKKNEDIPFLKKGEKLKFQEI